MFEEVWSVETFKLVSQPWWCISCVGRSIVANAAVQPRVVKICGISLIDVLRAQVTHGTAYDSLNDTLRRF
jgi:hypothetical protein